MDPLTAISPIDGRYQKKVKELSVYFSEYALIKKRVYVELMFLLELDKGDFLKIHDEFDLDDAIAVKKFEKETNHDIKAVEYFIKEKVPNDVKEFVHFGLTSEDINNLAYNLLVKEFISKLYIPKIQELIDLLLDRSQEWKSITVLARTHGQPASPTTLGKEYFIFMSRLNEQLQKIKQIKLKGKLNGATGNYNALVLAFPEKNWVDFSKNFVTKLGLDVNLITTQIEPKDTLVELFQCIKRINNIILDLNQDTWFYISLDYFSLLRKESEIGSSTMPHKVNPIDFENSEGNIKIANSLLTGFESLQVSRMQRDLSDSTMLRNIGVAFSHCMISCFSTLKGMNKLHANKKIISNDLQNHPEILTEGIQTVLRKSGKVNPYELLKELSRGKNITMDLIKDFIKNLDIDDDDKEKLLNLDPKNYIGLADKF
jgi:adenylosuccinate lyase